MPRDMALRLLLVTRSYSLRVSAPIAFSGRYRSPVTLLGLPDLVLHRCCVHRCRRLLLLLLPLYPPPRDLYRCTASCAFRALHSPARVPATASDLTSETILDHSSGLVLTATDILVSHVYKSNFMSSKGMENCMPRIWRVACTPWLQ